MLNARYAKKEQSLGIIQYHMDLKIIYENVFSVLYKMDENIKIIEHMYFDPGGFGSIAATFKDVTQ